MAAKTQLRIPKQKPKSCAAAARALGVTPPHFHYCFVRQTRKPGADLVHRYKQLLADWKRDLGPEAVAKLPSANAASVPASPTH